MNKYNPNGAIPGIPMRELERRSGFTRATINYYIKEGLLPVPQKSAVNMAYYSESFVEELMRIKVLKEQGNFTLKQIKDILQNVRQGRGEDVDVAMRVMKCLNQIIPYGRHEKDVTKAEILDKTGISEDAFNLLLSLKIIGNTADGENVFPAYAFTICQFVQFFLAMGIPAECANEVVRKINELIELECDVFVRYVCENEDVKNKPTEECIQIAEKSFKTINSLLPLLHLQLFKAQAEKSLEIPYDGN